MMEIKESPSDQGKKPTLAVDVQVHGTTATVITNTDLHISKEHYGQERKAGEGHIHMYLDGGEKVAVKETKMVFTSLSAGKHTLRVSLHNNDHTPYDVTQTVEFEVR